MIIMMTLRGRDAVTFGVLLTGGKSTGRVTLRSSNPFDRPVLEAGYFSHPEDIKVLVTQ